MKVLLLGMFLSVVGCGQQGFVIKSKCHEYPSQRDNELLSIGASDCGLGMPFSLDFLNEYWCVTDDFTGTIKVARLSCK
jgi:hypothetical protein